MSELSDLEAVRTSLGKFTESEAAMLLRERGWLSPTVAARVLVAMRAADEFLQAARLLHGAQADPNSEAYGAARDVYVQARRTLVEALAAVREAHQAERP
jgi:hypothetical protein